MVEEAFNDWESWVIWIIILIWLGGGYLVARGIGRAARLGEPETPECSDWEPRPLPDEAWPPAPPKPRGRA